MTVALRRVLAVAIAGCLLLAFRPPSGSAAVDAPSDQAQTTFAQIAGCLATGQELRVVLVVDESASLQDTDPDSQRTAGILATLDSLSLLQQGNPDKQVTVAAATFADKYVPRVGWGPASGGHLQDLRAFATDEVPQLNEGTATDYRAAMLGAQQALTTDPATACRVLLWFTDGGLDVGDSASATDAAQQEICTTGGIADALRADGIYVVSAALFRPDSALVDDADRAQLAQVAEGQAKGGSCGTVPVPERYAPGAYVSASDPSQLAALFAALMARISGFGEATSVQCPGDGCVAGAFNFPIDAGIARLRIIAVPTQGSAPSYTITEPGGATAELPANDSVPLGDFTVETSTAGLTTQVDIDLTKGAPVGQWAFNVKSGSALLGLYLTSGLNVALDPADQQVSANAESRIRLLITDPSQQPVDPDVYGSFKVSGRVDGGTDVQAEPDGDRWLLVLPPPAAGAMPSTRQLSVTIDAVTTPSGIALDPTVRQFVLPVSLSAYYPTIGQDALVMSQVSGDGSSTGTLAVTGSTQGPTRACVGPVTLSGPQGQEQVVAAPQTECLDLDAGGTGELVLRTDEFPVAADGTLAGSAQVTLFSAREQDPQSTLEVPARMSILRPVDEALRWGLVLALLALSLAIPLALVYLLGRRLARFDTGNAAWLRVIRVPVEVDFADAEARITRDGGSLRLKADDIGASSDPPHGKTRWLGPDIGLATEFTFWASARLGNVRVPTLALNPTARAVGAPGRILTSSANPYLRSDGKSAPADLRIERAWYLEFDPARLLELTDGNDGRLPESGSVPATLIVLRLDTDPGPVSARGEQIAGESILPLRMLQAALDQAAKMASELPALQPVGATTGGSGQGAAGPLDWMLGPDAAARPTATGDASGKPQAPPRPTATGAAPRPPAPPDAPEPDEPGAPGLPDWLR